MKIVIAPDKFKGSRTAAEVADALATGIGSARPGWTLTRLPVADGGDGTVDAALAAGWERIEVPAEGPTGEPLTSSYAIRDGIAVLELANSVGIVHLPGGLPDPLGAGTYGLGIVIADALDRGCREVVVGLGGSASTDGGAGLLVALGARVLDSAGAAVPLGAAGLASAESLDLAELHPAIARTRFVLACDVDNPLLGPRGAVAVYGPQKGVAEAEVPRFESALAQWAGLVERTTGRHVRDAAGAGAAGGAGFGAMAVLGAERRSGADYVLDLVGLAEHIATADLVITGEGSLDEQSLHGKAPIAVAERAHRAGVPVIAVAGRSLLTPDQIAAAGFAAVYTLAALEPVVERSIARAGDLVTKIGERIAADFS